jgi:hypothetical protein
LYDRTSEPFDAAFTTEEEDDTTPEPEVCDGVDVVATTPDDPFIVLPPAAVVFFMREPPRMDLLLNVRFALSFLSSLSTHLQPAARTMAPRPWWRVVRGEVEAGLCCWAPFLINLWPQIDKEKKLSEKQKKTHRKLQAGLRGGLVSPR